jgi:hypothetical protein
MNGRSVYHGAVELRINASFKKLNGSFCIHYVKIKKTISRGGLPNGKEIN